MIKEDFILLIMNCKKYVKKALFQKNTWIKNISPYLKYYHVIGDENLDIEYKFDNVNNVLYVKTPDDYNSLPNKVITSYQAVYETFQFKYIFKTDDDQILVNNKFFDIVCKLITSINPLPNYGGYIVDVKQPYLSQYNKIHPELPCYLPILVTKYCSGRFYFLSKDAIQNLIIKKGLIIKEYLEDYAIGFHLDIQFKTNMLSLDTNKFFKDIENLDL